MPNTFTRKLSRSIGTSAVAIGSYTVGSNTETTVIGLTLANRTASEVLAKVRLNDGTNDTFIVSDAPIPAGSSLVVVGGDQKVVLVTNDSITVESDTASSIDAIMSILEIT